MMICSRSLLDRISFLNCLNSSPFISGKTLAMGWNSYSCFRWWRSPADEAEAGLLVSVEVMTLPSHQPFAEGLLRIHSEANGLMRQSSLAWGVSPAVCAGRELLD